jgi:predicted enzyme related to lactoylglutathione lyase
MPTIVHFEIPTDDLERGKKFYGELFGWEIEKTPGPMDYWRITTTDEKGEKGLCGGMMSRQCAEHSIVNYIGVPSVDEYAAKIEQLSGKVVMPKTAVPGIGYFAVALDTENNAFAIWEDDKAAA